MTREKVLGYAEFGAYQHRDNGGKMNISAYTSVNKPLTIDGGHDETTKIAGRRYKIVEEEKAELNGSKFYEKEVWNVQEGDEKETKGPTKGAAKEYDLPEFDDEEEEGEEEEEKGPYSKGEAFLKNMVDNILADIRQQKMVNLGMIIIAVTSFVLSIIVAMKVL